MIDHDYKHRANMPKPIQASEWLEAIGTGLCLVACIVALSILVLTVGA